MPSIPERDLSPVLQWHPWPPGDPAPEIWRIIFELDRRVQLQAVNIVLQTQINQVKAHLDGLTKIQKLVSGAKAG
jgi:hypothetical protein